MEDQNNPNLEQELGQSYIEPPQGLSEDYLSRKVKVLAFLAENKKFILVTFLAVLSFLTSIALLAVKRSFKNKASVAEEERTSPEASLSPAPTTSSRSGEPERSWPTPTATQKVFYSPSPATATPKALPTATATATTTTPTPIPTPTPTPTPTPVPPDTTPPTFSQFTGPANGGVYDFSSFCFPMHLTDNVSGEIQVKYKFDDEDWSDWGTNYNPCYRDVENGAHQFLAQGRDAAGNETEIITRNFTIQAE